MGTIRVGIAGWTYAPWRGPFYPPGLVQSRELNYLSRQFATNEINATSKRLFTPANYRKWASEVPEDFVFSVKAWDPVTARKEPEAALDLFLGSGVVELGAKLGPLLWQLPDARAFDAAGMARLFGVLAAAGGGGALRHVVEARHPSFATTEFTDLAREHGIAVAITDSCGQWPAFRELTADFAYVRLIGSDEALPDGFAPPALDDWAARLRGWATGGADVYVYRVHGAKVTAPRDALALQQLLG